MSQVQGSEEGWASASHDSRRDMKQRDIQATVKAMQAASEARKKEWEDKLGDDLIEATERVVLRGGVNCVGYGRRYAQGFENWLRSLK